MLDPVLLRAQLAQTADLLRATRGFAVDVAAFERLEGEALFDSLADKLKAAGLGLEAGALRVKRTRTGCVSACKGGPILGVQPDGAWYYNVTEANLDRIVSEHLLGGQVVEDLLFHQGPNGT